MLLASEGEAVRFSTPDSLEAYVVEEALNCARISTTAAIEETFFLGLRLNRGVNLREVAAEFGQDFITSFSEHIAEFVQAGLMERHEDLVRLTPRGRLLSNEVFERFISVVF
jgi:oxygen-independent coproporphyrinogen-3 oxidase